MQGAVIERRCAVQNAGEDPDPVGSAPRFDELVLVEVPLPWPRDVGEVPELFAAVRASARRRILAVVPEAEREPGMRLITAYRRIGEQCCLSGQDVLVASDDVEDALVALEQRKVFDGTPAPPELVLCSHGSRDRCCGSMGTRLHHEVCGRWPDVRVRRSSHLGGHRFAPTGMSLPDGHLWAFLDVGVLDTILDDGGAPASVSRHCRGTPVLDAPFQLLERVALDRFGWEVLQWPVLDVAIVEGRHVLRFKSIAGVVSVSAEVAVHRELPVPDCGSGPGTAATISPEFVAHDAVVELG